MRLFFLFLALFATICEANPGFCYYGLYSNSEGKFSSENVMIKQEPMAQCSVIFQENCEIVLLASDEPINEIHVKCDSDGCNYEVASLKDKLKPEEKKSLEKCKVQHESAIRGSVSNPGLKPLDCAITGEFNNYKWEIWREAKKFYCTATFKGNCRLDFQHPDAEAYDADVRPSIKDLNGCKYIRRGDYGAVTCYCNSENYCSDDYKLWEEIVKKTQTKENGIFTNGCDYSGKKYNATNGVPTRVPSRLWLTTISPNVQQNQYNSNSTRNIAFLLSAVVILFMVI